MKSIKSAQRWLILATSLLLLTNVTGCASISGLFGKEDVKPIEVVAKQEQNFNSWLNEVTLINGNEVLNEFGQPIWSYEYGTYMFDKSLEKQINQRFGNNVKLYDTEVLDSNAIMQSGALRMRRTGTKPNKSTTRFVQSDLMKRIQQGEIKAVNVDGAEYGTTFSVSFGTDSIVVVLPPSSPLP